MGLWDNIGSAVSNLFSADSALSGLVSTALTGLALNQVSRSINSDNTQSAQTQVTEPDVGVRLQVTADTSHSIPVLYGSAVTSGAITEAVQSNDNQTMTYVITLAERTGTLLSTSAPSEYQFTDIYWNSQRVTFQSDGVTVAQTTDTSGNSDLNAAGLVQIYCYAGGSESGTQPTGYSSVTPHAYSVVPGWTTAHAMSDLIFLVVRVTYNAERGITGLGQVTTRVTNSMTLPGDCVLDYMTNSRYGAGIAPEDILVS